MQHNEPRLDSQARAYSALESAFSRAETRKPTVFEFASLVKCTDRYLLEHAQHLSVHTFSSALCAYYTILYIFPQIWYTDVCQFEFI